MESFGFAHWKRGFRSRWYRRPTPQRNRSYLLSDSSSDKLWWKRTGWQSDFRRRPRLSSDKSCIRPGPIPKLDPIETLRMPWRQDPARPEVYCRPLPRRYSLQAQPRPPQISPGRTMLVSLAYSLVHLTDSDPIYRLAEQEARTVPRCHTQPARISASQAHRYKRIDDDPDQGIFSRLHTTGCPSHHQSPHLYSDRPRPTPLHHNSTGFVEN